MWKALHISIYFVYIILGHSLWPFWDMVKTWPFETAWNVTSNLMKSSRIESQGAKTKVKNFETPFNFHNRDLLIMCLGRNGPEWCDEMWKYPNVESCGLLGWFFWNIYYVFLSKITFWKLWNTWMMFFLMKYSSNHIQTKASKHLL